MTDKLYTGHQVSNGFQLSAHPEVKELPYKYQPIDMGGSGITYSQQTKRPNELPRLSLDLSGTFTNVLEVEGKDWLISGKKVTRSGDF